MNGEGFAFFRWHSIKYHFLAVGQCSGYGKPFNSCRDTWRLGRR